MLGKGQVLTLHATTLVGQKREQRIICFIARNKNYFKSAFTVI